MTEYITKEQAKELIRNHILGCAMLPSPEYTLDDLFHDMCWDLNHIPSADVAPVIYAKWKFIAGPNEDNNLQFMCDNCGAGDVHAAGVTVPYCWRCGARMDGGENDD